MRSALPPGFNTSGPILGTILKPTMHGLASPGRAGVGLWLGVKGVLVLVGSHLANGSASMIEATCPSLPNPWAVPLLPVTDLSPGETHVAWDELEVGNLYRLMNSVELMAWGRNGPVLGQMFVNAGRIFVVREIDRLVPDDPWYHVRVIAWGHYWHRKRHSWMDKGDGIHGTRGGRAALEPFPERKNMPGAPPLGGDGGV